VHPFPDCRLRDAHFLGELGLSHFVVREEALELLHGATIGESYVASIGQTYVSEAHSESVPKLHKTGFWDRLVKALEKNGYEGPHQTTVAKLIGIKQPSVHLWQAGRTMPSMANVVKLADKLGVEVQWLLSDAKSKRKSIDIDRTAYELMAMWPQLSDITKGTILGIAMQSVQETPRRADDDDQDELHPSAG
jgi:transcriptional regulator with XRE-family HTH domain